MNKNKISLGLPSAWTVLLVGFIMLKVAGVTTMSWWWVFSPLWIPMLIVLAIGVIWLAVYLYDSGARKRKQKLRQRIENLKREQKEGTE